MSKLSKKYELRRKRKLRNRRGVNGSQERPRMSVFKSASHVYVQVINDEIGKTLLSVSSYDKGQAKRAGVEVCSEIGKKLAAACLEKKITKVVFDKNGNAYHGRVKAIAEGAREGGLQF